MNVKGLTPKQVGEIVLQFSSDSDGRHMVDAVGLDEQGDICDVHYKCTDTNCHCTGSWWQNGGKFYEIVERH